VPGRELGLGHLQLGRGRFDSGGLRPLLREVCLVLGHRRIIGDLRGVDIGLGDQLPLFQHLLAAEIPPPVRHGHLGLDGLGVGDG